MIAVPPGRLIEHFLRVIIPTGKGGMDSFTGRILPSFYSMALFCAQFTSCSVTQTMHCILFFLIAVVGPIIL